MPLPRTRCPKEGCREFNPCKTHTNTWRKSNRKMPGNWKSLVRAVKAHSGRVCAHCHQLSPAGQVDHITPHFEGGSDELRNLQWLCTNCHKIKSIAEAIRGRRRKP